MADVQVLLHVEDVEASIAPEIEAYEIVVDGQVYLTARATDPLQHVIMQFGHEVAGWGRAHGTEILERPFDVRTTPIRQRQPDLLVVLAEPRDGIGHGGMEGAPDLVVEVPSSWVPVVDPGEQRAEYEGIGVGEYLFIDPETGGTPTVSLPDQPWRRLDGGDVWRFAVPDGLEVALDRIVPPREP